MWREEGTPIPVHYYAVHVLIIAFWVYTECWEDSGRFLMSTNTK